MSGSRLRRLRPWLLLTTAATTLLALALAPRILRDSAREEPLLFEVVPIPDDAQWTGELGTDDRLGFAFDLNGWRAGWISVLEDGRPLERATRAQVRSRGGGLFHVGDRSVVLAPTGVGDPRKNDRWQIRRPRDLPIRLQQALLVMPLALTALLVAQLAVTMRWSGVRTIVPLALVSLAVVATLALAKRWLPPSTTDELGEKLLLYDKRRETIDTVFLGSSRVYRHLDPTTFEEEFQKQGQEVSAFNLGIPDMRMLETLHLAEWLFRRASSGLERLIVEVEDRPLMLREQNRLTDRVIRWHDRRTAERVIDGVQRLEAETPQKLLALSERLEPVARQTSAIGHGLKTVTTLLRASPKWFDATATGFVSLDQARRSPRFREEWPELEERWAFLHDRPGSWRRTVERLRASDPRGRLTNDYELDLLAELQALADARGVELVFVLSPRPERRPNLVHAQETGVIDRLIRFDDPAAYPDFYALEGRYDRHHLDHDAALEMTRILARALLGAATDGGEGEAQVPP